MHTDSDTPPKWERWLWEVDASEAAEEREGGKGLGVGKIVRAGIALADDEGLEGVSVRKLAQRLSVSTMAAYRHISSRDEVIAAMVDVAFGPPPVLSGRSEDWSGGLRCWALAVHACYDAHPWLLDQPGRIVCDGWRQSSRCSPVRGSSCRSGSMRRCSSTATCAPSPR